MLGRSFGKSFSSSHGQDSGFLRERFISGRSPESEDGIVTNDGGDSLSDSSDDTSYSTWKGPPPPDKRQHRYLDEMRVRTIPGQVRGEVGSGMLHSKYCSPCS